VEEIGRAAEALNAATVIFNHDLSPAQQRNLETQLGRAVLDRAELILTIFAQRARTELLATGEHARRRTIESADDLTPQETQVAKLAAAGETNTEIATQLFISPRTAEHHIQNIYTKIGVSNRAAATRWAVKHKVVHDRPENG